MGIIGTGYHKMNSFFFPILWRYRSFYTNSGLGSKKIIHKFSIVKEKFIHFVPGYFKIRHSYLLE